MSDLTKTASHEIGSPIFIDIHDTNAQFPSPIQEFEDISRSILTSAQIMPDFDGNVITLKDAGIQTDLSFPFNLPNNVQNVLNTFTVMAEISDSESINTETKLIDSSGSECIQQDPCLNYNIPSPTLTDEDLKILYESLSSNEPLGDLFHTVLQENRILSPPLSDIDSQLMTPEDLEVAEINMNYVGAEL